MRTTSMLAYVLGLAASGAGVPIDLPRETFAFPYNTRPATPWRTRSPGRPNPAGTKLLKRLRKGRISLSTIR